MRFCSIASGSSGNCIYIEGSGTHILVDAGISMKRIISGLSNLGVEPTDLDAILITHEHSDHVGGVEVLVNKYQIPIYSTEETLGVVREKDKRKRLDPVLFHPIVPDTPFHIKNMEITPFSTSHDARNPVCYTVKAEGHKVGVATDLGTYDDYIISHLAGSEILLLEANHDIAMLQVGPYPYALKKRADRKSLLILTDRIDNVSKYCQKVPEVAWQLLEVADKPLTLILPQARGVAENVVPEQGTIGIRVADHDVNG